MADSPELTAAARRKLRKTQFGLPDDKAYPIDTIGRARNALARVSQHGTPEDKQQVAEAASKKYPSLKNSPFVRAQRLLAAKGNK